MLGDSRSFLTSATSNPPSYNMDYTYGLMASRARYIHALERQTSPAKRVVIALAGPPGSGKSTAAQRVVDLLNQNQ
jgi:pantothenate kinase